MGFIDHEGAHCRPCSHIKAELERLYALEAALADPLALLEALAKMLDTEIAVPHKGLHVDLWNGGLVIRQEQEPQSLTRAEAAALLAQQVSESQQEIPVGMFRNDGESDKDARERFHKFMEG